MGVVSFGCNYECGTPRSLLFHYKMEHKDKVSKCACGDQTISDNCVGGITSELRGIPSKCSSSNSSSNSSSSYNPKTGSIAKTDGAPPLVPQKYY